jgi:hypothetical protein
LKEIEYMQFRRCAEQSWQHKAGKLWAIVL